MGDLTPTGATRCTSNKRTGGRCNANAVKGSQPPRCPNHVGKTLVQAKAEGMVRVELTNWGTDDSYVDPGEQFLRLIAQSARRCELYSSLLQADYEDRKVAALVGTAYSEGGPSGEYLRGLAELEARERRFCADLCGKAIAAGIEARKVQIAQQQTDQFDVMLRAILASLGHDPDSPDVRSVVYRQLELVRR